MNSLSIPKIHTSIKVHTTFEGLHCYPNAPEEVKDLRDLHRHIFHVRLQVSVDHSDRELEFFLVKHQIENTFTIYPKESGVLVLGAKSCEMIAQDIYSQLCSPLELFRREVTIEVSEDDNNSAIVIFEPIR